MWKYGTDFLCEFGNMYEQYYCSLESVFSNALKLMKTDETYLVKTKYIKNNVYAVS